MKKHIKSFAVTSVGIAILGLGAHQANASGVDFSVGINVGIPVVATHVYAPAPRYATVPVAPRYTPVPVRVCQVEKVRYTNGYGYRPAANQSWQAHRDYRQDRFRNDRDGHRGWDRNYR
jgi:hypothetical protein